MSDDLPDLLNWKPPAGDRDGKTYEPEHDRQRLNGQAGRVYDTMQDGAWRTLAEIGEITGDPQQSISARLRDFRKAKFGGLAVERRRRGDPVDGLFEYRVQKGD